PLDRADLEMMDTALEGMIETYEDIKHRVQEALDGYRRSRLSVVRADEQLRQKAQWQALQLAISGTSVWRRIVVYDSFSLWDLHRIILALFGWSGEKMHGFVIDGEMYDTEGSASDRDERLVSIGEIIDAGVTEFVYNYDYNAEWEVRISYLHPVEEAEAPSGVLCIAGAGAAPPEHVGGPLRYRRMLAGLQKGNSAEQAESRKALGENFDPDQFDSSTCNNRLLSLSLQGEKE
ncbi:MAG: plasmid pRiA4b ORF-3 family protein, partial [Treponema sp.]|nr:plasmid pRiA4b ORF-3 family protein [Treponema sp.]